MSEASPACPRNLAGVSTGDTQFAAGIVRLTPVLRGFARRLYRNDEAAADLTQETLAKAWQARAGFAAGTNLRAWLLTIMRNQFRSEARRNWRQMPWDEGAAEGLSGPPSEQLWSVELGDAARAIDTLSARQREALILSAVGGFSSVDVGAILHCPPSAAKTRVHRARRAVSAMLEGREQIRLKRGEDDGHAIAALVSQLHQLIAASAGRAPAHSAMAWKLSAKGGA